MSRTATTRRITAGLASGLLLIGAALAAEPARPNATLVDLTVEASRPAANDMVRATAFAESTDPNPGELARRINTVMSGALQSAKAYPTVKVRSGNSQTQPIYARGGTRIESWRMRTELLLESQDQAAFAELLGKLQGSLSISQIGLLPSPETRRKAEDAATQDGIAAFRARAKLVADTLGKPFRIRQLSIGTGGRPPVVPLMRAAAMSEGGGPVLEAGESQVTVTVSGQVELPLD